MLIPGSFGRGLDRRFGMRPADADRYTYHASMSFLEINAVESRPPSLTDLANNFGSLKLVAADGVAGRDVWTGSAAMSSRPFVVVRKYMIPVTICTLLSVR